MLIELYNKVFDENGNIKLCRRETCQALIKACSELEPSINFGDEKTGCMDVINVRKFVEGRKQQ